MRARRGGDFQFREKDLDNQLRRTGYSISGRYLFAAFVADVHEVGDDAAEVAEDHAGSGEDFSDRVLPEILDKDNQHIPDCPLMNQGVCAGNEEFSFDKLVAVSIFRLWLEEARDWLPCDLLREERST